MEATATLKYLKASPQKVRLVVDLVRGEQRHEARDRRGERAGAGVAERRERQNAARRGSSSLFMDM